MNPKSSPQDLKLLENYLLQPYDEFMSKLIKGTDQYYYFTFLKLISSSPVLNDEQKKQLEEFQTLKSSLAQNIGLRALFLEYDSLNGTPSPETEGRQKTIIQKIAKQLFNLNFEHQQPNRLFPVNQGTDTPGLTQTTAKDSQLKQSLVEYDTYLKDAYTEQGFKKISAPLYTHLDLQKIATSHISVVKGFMHNIGSEIVDMQGIPQFYLDVSKHKDFKNDFQQAHFKKLSLVQMEELGRLEPKFYDNQNFVGELYLKKFQYDLKDINYKKLTEAEKKKLKENLLELYTWALTLAPKFKSFSDQLLQELLQVGIELYDYDFKLFETYLKDPKELYDGANEAQTKFCQKNTRQYQNVWHSYHQLNTNRWYATNQLIDSYLRKYFDKEEDTSRFLPYFDQKFLNKVKAEVKLYHGQELQNIYDHFTSQQIEAMNNQKLITICDYNRFYFSHDTPVILYVELKNIPSLNIKIFEFNSENYYIQRQQELDPSVELDGLIAFEETTFTYKEPPIVKFTKEFTFSTINKVERGVFIVEFIGNGVSSRAIIKKGRLQLRDRITPAGHAIQILNENFELCAGARTGLWLDNKFYAVNERKEVLIPFGQTDKLFKAIIVHENFSEITDLKIQQEIYDFRGAFIIPNESLLMGAQAKALIYPKLFVNGCETSVNLIKSQQVSITSTNDAGVPSTTPYENIKFSDTEPIEIHFPITAKIKTVEIKVSGKIQRLHKQGDQTEQTVELHHSIGFDNQENQPIFTHHYVRYTEEAGYTVYLLGKNGEPKCGIDIEVSLALRNYSERIRQQLRTDSEGKVVLGHLKNITQITAEARKIRDIEGKRVDITLIDNSAVSNPGLIRLLPNEEIKIPFFEEKLDPSTVCLVRQFEQGGNANISSLTNTLRLEDNNLYIKLAEPGSYQLTFTRRGEQIYLKVLEGERWKNSRIIKSKQTLIKDESLSEGIVISSLKTEQTKEGLAVSGRVHSSRKSHLIAVASNFFSNNDSHHLKKQIESILISNRSELQTIQLYSSIFQSNKELSDEQKYVLNRKTQERYIGNTLEKPQILLKRQLVRETNTSDEQLSSGSNYQQQQLDRSRAAEERQSRVLRGGAGSANRAQIVVTSQDFLKNQAQLISNVQINDGNFTFQVPTHFSSVTLFAFNDSKVSMNLVGLPRTELETRNLTHKSALNKDKFYSIFRNSQLIPEGQAVQIKDLTSTEIKLVDSLDKIFIQLQELRKAQGGDNEQSGGFQHWEFLTKWHTNSVEQKHKLYDEHQCDELNLFIYFRDPAFFDTYTKAYIENKIERSFIDHFLLQDHSILQELASVERIQELNALEQALLVIYFAEMVNKPEQAQAIASYLENKNKLVVVDQKQFKLLFDTALGAKTEGDQEGGPPEGLAAAPRPMMQARMCNMMVQQAMPMSRTAPMMQQQRLMCMNQATIMPTMAIMQQNCVQAEEAYDDIVDECYAYDAVQAKSASSTNYYENKRAAFIENFKNIEKTKEYAEKHYAKTTALRQHRDLVGINGFWVDLANHSIKKGILKEDFLTHKFIFCNQNHTQMIAVLALIGLPNEAPVQEYKQLDGKGVEIVVKRSAILFTKEIKEGQAQLRNDILVAQRFFDPQDRYIFSEEDPDLQLEKDVDECLVDKIYGCQVIITNCSSTRADYQVLIEVPNGSIPVSTIAYTKSYTITLQPYSTERLEYFFYFPKVGQFEVYPANVSRFGQVVCVAKELSLTVVTSKTVANLEVLDDILAKGNKEDILNFLQTKNIFNSKIFKIHEILYLLKNKEFYLQVIEVLRRRRFLDYSAWSYSIYHNDHQGIKEFFNMEQVAQTLKNQFNYFKCSLFEISNIRFLEYYPLITKRVHKLSQEVKGILNNEFRAQYIDFLQYLSQKGQHSVADKLCFIYYLLLQERINEAIQIYQTIKEPPKQGECQLQYDYFTAYLDFYIGFPNFIKAREICEKYLNYPVIHWRNLFYEIVNQLAEYDGDDDENQKQQVEETQKKKQQNQAKKEETLASVIEGNQILVTYSNLAAITVQFYKIDLEILFSRNPFLNKSESDFSYVLPNLQVQAQLEADQQAGVTYKHTLEIPEELRQSNLFIQIKGVDKRTSNRYFSTSLNVQVMENFGQIRVSDASGKYLSKVYVKAYLKEKSGPESFYKDGYTDLRGRFDYASLSSSALTNAEKFALLITSDTLGSIIKEVKAPAQIGQYQQEVKLVSKNWYQRAEKEQISQATRYETSKMMHKCK